MKAAVLYELKTPLKVEDIDLDNPKGGEVRVKIAANGVCHSDYSVIHGVLRWPLPVVIGHEGAGVVEEVGPGVTLVKPGDHVVLSFRPLLRALLLLLDRPARLVRQHAYNNGKRHAARWHLPTQEEWQSHPPYGWGIQLRAIFGGTGNLLHQDS